MNIAVDLKKTGKESIPSSCHRIPCRIKFSGSAKVSDYFEPTIKRNEDKNHSHLESSFRGRPLLGTSLQLPSGYKGALLDRQDKDEKIRFSKSKSFDSITAWELDRDPKLSQLHKAYQWMQVASSIHGQVLDQNHSS